MTKKQMIISAAVELFAEKGIEATSVQQITEKCGISKGAFYLHFKSKEQLTVAILDYFMQNALLKIDQSVISAESNDEKLYQYYYESLSYFQQYKSLALIFLREQMADVGDLCFQKMLFYEGLTMLTISEMLDSIFGERLAETKYDLILLMQGMLKTYMNVLLFINQTLDLHIIARSLVEKTNVLVEHSSIHILNKTHLSHDLSSNISSDIIRGELEAIETTDLTPLEQQSIEVLVEQFQQPIQQQAIVVGLLHNIKDNQKLHWVSFLIKHFVYK